MAPHQVSARRSDRPLDARRTARVRRDPAIAALLDDPDAYPGAADQLAVFGIGAERT